MHDMACEFVRAVVTQKQLARTSFRCLLCYSNIRPSSKLEVGWKRAIVLLVYSGHSQREDNYVIIDHIYTCITLHQWFVLPFIKLFKLSSWYMFTIYCEKIHPQFAAVHSLLPEIYSLFMINVQLTWWRELSLMWSTYEIIHIWTAVVDESEEWSSRWSFFTFRIVIVNISPWSKPEVGWREPEGELIVIMTKSNVSVYAIGEDKVKKYILVQLFIAFLQSSPLPVSLTKTFPVV